MAEVGQHAASSDRLQMKDPALMNIDGGPGERDRHVGFSALEHAHTQLEIISDSFPLPQSPTTVHPERIVDASVRCSIPEWKEQTNGSSLRGGRVGAIVVKANKSELEGFVSHCLAVFKKITNSEY